jgi:hypothetical protein
MKLILATLTLSTLLTPLPLWTSASAGTYYGRPFYGYYATHRYGPKRFYEVRDRFRH